MISDQKHNSSISFEEIKRELFAVADEKKREFLPYFFKTGEGQYGAGDQFIGVVVPEQRAIVKKYHSLPLNEIELLLEDAFHECRMTGLLFLVEMYTKSKDEREKEEFFDFYIQHRNRINNWDLVDLSSPQILGGHLWKRDRKILYQFALEKHLWTQRIAIIATYFFIKNNDYSTTFDLAKLLLTHPHDLIQKAVGWMLREIGKRNFEAEIEFLSTEQRYQQMPRTMLRYTIERFPENLRQQFLKNEI